MHPLSERRLAVVEVEQRRFSRRNERCVERVDEEAAAIDTISPRRPSFYIIAFALCESVWLFGFVLSFLGEPLSTAITFLAIALILMTLCFPRQV